MAVAARSQQCSWLLLAMLVYGLDVLPCMGRALGETTLIDPACTADATVLSTAIKTEEVDSIVTAIAAELASSSKTSDGNDTSACLADADPLTFANMLAAALYPYQPGEECSAVFNQASPLSGNETQALGEALALLVADAEAACNGADKMASNIVRGLALAMERCTGPANLGPASESMPYEMRIAKGCCHVAGPTLEAALAAVEASGNDSALAALAAATTQLYDAQSMGSAVYDASVCAFPACAEAVAEGCCTAEYSEGACGAGGLSPLQGSAETLSMATGLPSTVTTVRLWTGANDTLPGSVEGTCRCGSLLTGAGGYVGTRLIAPVPGRRLIAAATALGTDAAQF